MESRKYKMKELRARLELTQKETAKRLGITTATYNAWEKNPANVAISKIQKVADLFGVTLEQIFF